MLQPSPLAVNFALYSPTLLRKIRRQNVMLTVLLLKYYANGSKLLSILEIFPFEKLIL